MTFCQPVLWLHSVQPPYLSETRFAGLKKLSSQKHSPRRHKSTSYIREEHALCLVPFSKFEDIIIADLDKPSMGYLSEYFPQS